MQRANRRCFQVLTKRPERLLEISHKLHWIPNIWIGVTVKGQSYQHRIDHPRQTSAPVKFLPLEPLLGPIPNMNLEGINWVIVGGESGPKSQLVDNPWAVNIRNQCKDNNVAFFFKQWGGTNKKKAGRKLEEHTWDEMPSFLLSTPVL